MYIDSNTCVGCDKVDSFADCGSSIICGCCCDVIVMTNGGLFGPIFSIVVG